MKRKVGTMIITMLVILAMLQAAVASTSTHAFIWDKTTGMQDLGTLPGGTISYAYGINKYGQIVGENY